MPFFTNKGPSTLINADLTAAAEAAKTQTYADADYYIAELKDQPTNWTITDYSSVADSHDTSINQDNTGPEDHYGYYGNLSNKAAKLSIIHEPTKYAVMFPAIIDSYTESFKANYESEQLYGRMDPVQKYVNTSRTISVSFKVLAYDEDHAHRNVHALSTLAEFLYPVYDYDGITGSLNNATAMRESPLWRVRFANLIQKTSRGVTLSKNPAKNYIQDGLLVAPTSFSFEPNLEAGFFIVENTYNFPKEIKVSLSFAALHEQTMGWLYDSNPENLRYEWIGNIDTNGNRNQSSTVFPWGDYSLNDAIGVVSKAKTSDAATAKAELEFTDEDFTGEPTEEDIEYARQFQQSYVNNKKG